MAHATATLSPTKPAPAALHPTVQWTVLGILLFLGLCIRLFHITEPPLDFHGQRQYWDANRARAIYYQSNPTIRPELKELAKKNSQAPTEPPVLETLAVIGYRAAGGENIAIPRAFSAIFWIIGGYFLFLLAARLFSPGVAFVPLAFYLFAPFGVVATRTFQPDPLMTACTIASLYATYRYFTEPNRKRFLWAAVAAALAVFIKPMALFFVVPAFLALTLAEWLHKPEERPRLTRHLLLFGVALLIGLCWILWALFVGGTNVQNQAGKTFLPQLLVQSGYWISWLMMLANFIGAPWLILGITGMLLCRDRLTRALLVGGWIGYVVFGLFFNYHIYTHSYYSLPLFPITALSLGVLAAAAAPLFTALPAKWPLVAAAVVMTVGVLIYDGYQLMHPEYQEQVRVMEEIGEVVGHNANCIFLTRDYGDPLRFHGQLGGVAWPIIADLAHEQQRGITGDSAEVRLMKYMENYNSKYFVVTEGGEFTQQRELFELITARYPMIASTRDYAVFDLTRPKAPAGPSR